MVKFWPFTKKKLKQSQRNRRENTDVRKQKAEWRAARQEGRKKPPDQEQLSKIISRSGASVSRSAPIDEMISMWFFVWKLRREKKTRKPLKHLFYCVISPLLRLLKAKNKRSVQTVSSSIWADELQTHKKIGSAAAAALTLLIIETLLIL